MSNDAPQVQQPAQTNPQQPQQAPTAPQQNQQPQQAPQQQPQQQNGSFIADAAAAAQQQNQAPAAAQQQQTQGQAPKFTGGVMDAYGQNPAQAPVTYEYKDASGNVVNDSNTQLVSGVAKELGLSADQAQKLWEKGLGANGLVAQVNQQAIQKLNAQWANEITSDPQLGGAHLEQTKHNVGRAMAYADDEFKTFIQNSGLGNLPSLVRFLNKVGAQMNSDMSYVSGNAAAASSPIDSDALLAAMYKNSPDMK